ncbi:MAG: M48 family metallopeptidase [Fibrobacteres bacterium]|nr:M48 family metallopeptidase [Fibrobacterota bacterium]
MDSDPGPDPDSASPVYWEGTAEFFDGRQAKAHVIIVTIGPQGLEVRQGDAAGVYRRGEFELTERGGDDRFFSLALKAHAGAALAFRERPEALEWLRAAGLLRRNAWSATPLWGRALVLSGFLILFGAFMYFAGLDMLVNATVRALPPSIDHLLGGSATRAFESKLVKPPKGAARRALDKSAAMVFTLRPGYRDSVRILIVRDTSIKNAFAFPGGAIVVYTGMLRLLETQEEWMGLLAHEGAHLHLRHGTRRLVRGSLLGLGVSLLLGDMSGAGSVLLDNAGNLINLNYGRRDEAEADAFALETLRAHGYSASGLQTLFRKFLKFKELPGWAAFLSTHPATRDRIAAMKDAGKGPHGLLLTAEEWAALKRL